MSAVARNRDLFHAIAQIIEDDPSRYDQRYYIFDTHGRVFRSILDDAGSHPCNTVCCIAGHAVLLCLGENGLTEAVKAYGPDGNRSFPSTHLQRAVQDRLPQSAPRAISMAAAQELGLTTIEANVLFDTRWRPAEDLDVPTALRLLGEGAAVTDVTAGGS